MDGVALGRLNEQPPRGSPPEVHGRQTAFKVAAVDVRAHVDSPRVLLRSIANGVADRRMSAALRSRKRCRTPSPVLAFRSRHGRFGWCLKDFVAQVVMRRMSTLPLPSWAGWREDTSRVPALALRRSAGLSGHVDQRAGRSRSSATVYTVHEPKVEGI